MYVERIDRNDLPELWAQVRRFLKTDEVALFRVGSGTVIGFEGDVPDDQAARRPPQVLVRCKEGGGYELSGNL